MIRLKKERTFFFSLVREHRPKCRIANALHTGHAGVERIIYKEPTSLVYLLDTC